MKFDDDRIIVAKGLSHSYASGKRALNNINLELGSGLIGLLGANGAGKTTLMRIFSTLIEPTAGTVTVAGSDIKEGRMNVRKQLGYLPQEFGAWKTFNVEEVLRFLASLSNSFSLRNNQSRVGLMLEKVGLQDVKRRKVKSLSGGMLRRLGLAQALIHDPQLIILDEPTVGLDPEERLRFRKLIAELSEDRTVILSTHIVSDFGTSCSDLIHLHRGEIRFNGSPDKFLERAKGRILELSVDFELAEKIELEEDFDVIQQSSQNNKIILRGVAKNNWNYNGATIVNDITMEEAYIAFSSD